MRTPGPIALTGGGEHLPPTTGVDRKLIDLTGSLRPRVVVLPQAPSKGQLAKTVALARNHWTRLGAGFAIATVEMGIERAIEELSSADIAVLPGGHPNKLVAGLGASPLTDVLVARWLSGMAVSGSSAGAMGLFEWRIKLYPPNPLRLLPGLGLLDGYVAAPHFDRFKAGVWAHMSLGALNGLGVLGLDEATALVGYNRELQAVGRGSVTLIDHHEMTRVNPGETIDVDLLARRKLPGSSIEEPTTGLPSRFQDDFEWNEAMFAANGSRSTR